jgi:hypothetical protein
MIVPIDILASVFVIQSTFLSGTAGSILTGYEQFARCVGSVTGALGR